MNSKPFEMTYLIASDWSVESFTWKGPEKLRGYEKFFGSFEKRKNCFLSFAFHANSGGRVATMATLSHGCKPRDLRKLCSL